MPDPSKMTDEELYKYLTNEDDQTQDEEANEDILEVYLGEK